MEAKTSQQPRVDAHVRWMIRRDMPSVHEIERNCFAGPWSEENFLGVLRERNCIGMVAELPDGEIGGFVVFELHKTHLEILNLAVAHSRRRSGLGRRMVEKLQGKLSGYRRTHLLATVSELNLKSQLFFRALGFRATRVLRSFYVDQPENGPEDAYEMRYDHPSAQRWRSPNRISHLVGQ